MRFRYLVLCAALGLSACAPTQQVSTQQAAPSAEETALLTRADVARALGRRAEAQQLYEQAAATSQGSIRAHLELADMYRAAGRHKDALTMLEAAHALNPRNVEVLKGYAQQALRMGDDATARRMAEQGLSQSPEDARLLNVLGVVSDRAGEHQQAQEHYARAMAVLSGEVDREYTLNNYALSAIATHDYGKAITLLEPALPTARNKTALRQLLALAYGAKGELDHAYELGLMDMNVVQVQENLEFYRRFGRGEVDSAVLFQPFAG